MPEPETRSSNSLVPAQIALVVFGLLAPFLTFGLAASGLPGSAKVALLVLLAMGYAGVCFWAFRKTNATISPEVGTLPDEDLREEIAAIGTSAEFFGSSLRPEDLFRLISSRVSHVFPFLRSALFATSDSRDRLTITHAAGPGSDALIGVEVPADRGLAAMALISGEVEFDTSLGPESVVLPAATEGVRCAAAIPLIDEGRTFAVLVLYTDRPINPSDPLPATLELVGKQVAPLLLTSMSFERSVASALTDPITRLPNERAFYVVLENQLAESQRSRDERPLTVLSIDIKNFAEVNQHAGYEAGDRMLSFTAENIAGQLRKMDFLSRTTADEFLLILPTASEAMAVEIIERIRCRFATSVFALSENEEAKVWLNFGAATFWKDGETVEQLLQTARVRKQQAKAEEPSKVIWFPKEYVN